MKTYSLDQGQKSGDVVSSICGGVHIDLRLAIY